MAEYLDIANFEEDDRIDLMGHYVMDHKKTTAFMTDDDPKADRYIEKLKIKFPGIRVIARGSGPIKNVVWVKIGPPLN